MSLDLGKLSNFLGKVRDVADQVAKAVPATAPVIHQVEDAFDQLISSDAAKYVNLVGSLAYDLAKEKNAKFEVLRDPELPVPPDRGELKVASYNILLGGQRIDQVEQTLRAQAPDVVCLQETSRESAIRLGKSLGMHVAFTNLGDAVLSRYPITEAKQVQYDVPWEGRIEAGFRIKDSEPFIPRALVQVTLQVGDRQLDVIDTHLSLRDPTSNALELEQLGDRIAAMKAQGRSVLVAGDFNHNFAIGEGGSAASPETDTVEEFRERYPKAAVGNAADPRAHAAAVRLDALTQDTWEAQHRQVRTADGVLTPEQALSELRSGTVPRGSERWQLLTRVVDGVTHLGANKRFDNVFAAGDLSIRGAEVDWTAPGSDHSPVLATVEWK